jgi:hypothetical protein
LYARVAANLSKIPHTMLLLPMIVTQSATVLHAKMNVVNSVSDMITAHPLIIDLPVLERVLETELETEFACPKEKSSM